MSRFHTVSSNVCAWSYPQTARYCTLGRLDLDCANCFLVSSYFLPSACQRPVALEMKELLYGSTINREVLVGFGILALVYAMIIFNLMHHTTAAMMGSFMVLGKLVPLFLSELLARNVGLKMTPLSGLSCSVDFTGTTKI